MKKIILIFATLFATISVFAETKTSILNGVETVYADTKDVVTTVYNDGKDIITTMYPEIKEAIVSIASAIGVAAEHVYDVLVKKFIVDGVMEAMFFITGLILLTIGFFNLNKYIKNNEILNWKIAFPVILLCVSFEFLFSVNYQTMLMGIINPEFGAINYIIEYTKNLAN